MLFNDFIININQIYNGLINTQKWQNYPNLNCKPFIEATYWLISVIRKDNLIDPFSFDFMKYLEIIKYAIIFFPLVAFLFTFPFILVEYHKFGSISVYKSFILYLFILYLICAYFLVILPLPTIREVALLKTPRTQLVPFMFIVDFIKMPYGKPCQRIFGKGRAA